MLKTIWECLALAGLILFSVEARAPTILPSSQSLAVAPGQTYRFIAVSTQITADYDAIVQADAELEGVGSSVGLTWKALVGEGSCRDHGTCVPAGWRVDRVECRRSFRWQHQCSDRN